MSNAPKSSAEAIKIATEEKKQGKPPQNTSNWPTGVREQYLKVHGPKK